MLVVTRRPGESVRIGDNIEVLIVDVDSMDLETRCAIRVCDQDGNEVHVRHTRSRTGVTVIRMQR